MTSNTGELVWGAPQATTHTCHYFDYSIHIMVIGNKYLCWYCRMLMIAPSPHGVLRQCLRPAPKSPNKITIPTKANRERRILEYIHVYTHICYMMPIYCHGMRFYSALSLCFQITSCKFGCNSFWVKASCRTLFRKPYSLYLHIFSQTWWEPAADNT